MTSLLAGAVERVPLDGHDGRSGARLERVRLADGRSLVVKRARPGEDLAAAATSDANGREQALWRAGVLDRLPMEVGHPVLDAWAEADGTVVTVMRDLGTAVLGWERRRSAAETGRIVDAAAAVHAAFAGQHVAGLCSLEDRLALFAPSTIRRHVPQGHPLRERVLRGWEVFADAVPADVADAVLAVLADPRPLANRLRAAGTTLLHGDLWLVNVALEGDRVVLLDWGLATAGPPALEVVSFLAGCASRLDVPREAVLDRFRRAESALHDEPTLRLALLAGLSELGWTKALDATSHPDPGLRARERADLDWWVARARAALGE